MFVIDHNDGSNGYTTKGKDGPPVPFHIQQHNIEYIFSQQTLLPQARRRDDEVKALVDELY